LLVFVKNEDRKIIYLKKKRKIFFFSLNYLRKVKYKNEYFLLIDFSKMVVTNKNFSKQILINYYNLWFSRILLKIQ